MHEINSHNFTLIVPTHNRHHYLKRSIAFFKDLEAYVIYCDSSLNPYIGLFKTNMKYVHVPGKQFAEKVLIALNCIRTDYVAMCADDDFILYSALYKGILALEKDKSFKTVVGKYIGFHDQFDGKFYSLTASLPSDINFNGSDNAKIFFSNYHQILWAMYKIDILKSSFDIINKAHFTNDNFIELVIGAIVCYAGGIKFLNAVWGVRELSYKLHWGNCHKSISNIYQDSDIMTDFYKMRALLDSVTFFGFSNLVLKNYLKGHGIENTSQQAKEILKGKIKGILPKKVLTYIRRKRSPKTYNNSFEKYPNLSIHNSNNNLHELNQIREIILAH